MPSNSSIWEHGLIAQDLNNTPGSWGSTATRNHTQQSQKWENPQPCQELPALRQENSHLGLFTNAEPNETVVSLGRAGETKIPIQQLVSQTQSRLRAGRHFARTAESAVRPP